MKVPCHPEAPQRTGPDLRPPSREGRPGPAKNLTFYTIFVHFLIF